jgi:hypothetical protein
MTHNIKSLLKDLTVMKSEFSILKTELESMASLTIKDLNTLKQGNIISLGESFGFIKNKVSNLYQRYQTAKNGEADKLIVEIDGFLRKLIDWLNGIQNADENTLSQYFSIDPNNVDSAKYFDKTISNLSLKIIELNKRLDFTMKEDKILLEDSTQISDFSKNITNILGSVDKSATCSNTNYKNYYKGFLYKSLMSQLASGEDFVKFNQRFRTYDIFNNYFIRNILPKVLPNYDTKLRNLKFHSDLTQSLFLLIGNTTLSPDNSSDVGLTVLFKQEAYKMLQPMYPKFNLVDFEKNHSKVQYGIIGRSSAGSVNFEPIEFVLTGNVEFVQQGQKPVKIALTDLVLTNNDASVAPVLNPTTY